jgi:hypothetical protein
MVWKAGNPEEGGRKGSGGWGGWRVSGFLRQAQDRLFALERGAQDDGRVRATRSG